MKLFWRTVLDFLAVRIFSLPKCHATNRFLKKALSCNKFRDARVQREKTLKEKERGVDVRY